MAEVRKGKRKVAAKKEAAKKADHAARRAAKQEGSGKRPSRRAVPMPGDLPAGGKREYLLATKAVLAVLPPKAPGLGLGNLMKAVHAATSRRDFPGDTHRPWVKRVLLDLRDNGAVAQTEDEPPSWFRT